MQLLHHYWVDRNNPSVYVTTTNNQGKTLPRIEGLEIIHRLTDENGIDCFLSRIPDEEEVTETVDGVTRTYTRYRVTETEGAGLNIVTQTEWDQIITDFDARQNTKRVDVVRKYRDQLLNKTDWVVVKAKETGGTLSTDFKSWRTSLRDLPTVGITTHTLPTAPVPVEGVEDTVQSAYESELRAVRMITDPLPASTDLPGIE